MKKKKLKYEFLMSHTREMEKFNTCVMFLQNLILKNDVFMLSTETQICNKLLLTFFFVIIKDNALFQCGIILM